MSTDRCVFSGKDIGSLICNVGSGAAASVGGGGGGGGGATSAEAGETKAEEKKEEVKEESEESDDDMGFGECNKYLSSPILIRVFPPYRSL